MKPRVVLIGDSIRMGYQKKVRAALQGLAIVKAPHENCGNSFRLREHLGAWVIAHRPDVVHFNAGIHDLGWMPGEEAPRFTTTTYARNLRLIAERLQRETEATLVFATTTPFLLPFGAETPPAECTVAAVVARYNRAATKVMQAKGVELNDLYGEVMRAGPQRCLGPDKLHMNERGHAVLSRAVVAAVRKAGGF